MSASLKRKLAPEAVEGTKRAKENVNKEICDFLSELANHEKNVERNIHKHNVYRKASRSIAACKDKITSGKEAKKLEGVGAKIAAKIDEFLSTGSLAKLNKIKADPRAQAIQLIASVVGFGPVAAQKYVEKGVTTLEQLKEEEGLTATQRIGVDHYDDFQERIPREEMDMLKAEAISIMKTVNEELEGNVCGSYRRGASSSGDIDILLTHPSFLASDKNSKGKITDSTFKSMLSKVVKKMEERGFVTNTLSCGETKFMGVCRHQLVDGSEKSKETVEDAPVAKWKYRRIDIRFWPYDQYQPALLYFTGSDELNKEMRRKAIDLGFHLNEYCIKPIGEGGKEGDALPVTCEKDIFDYLDMKYLEPSER
eukprot:m.43239 g.43239  ORF g.43239 m.43239 type:complete len:367 (-) comp7099_c0_seq5:149-1249(-)